MRVFIPSYNSMVLILLLATLAFSSGCDSKQQVRIGDTAPAISGNDMRGELVRLDKLKGKIVVLFFWTNSCCGDRLKLLEPYYSQNNGKNFEILAVNVGDSRTVVESYAKTNGLTFTLLTDERAINSKQYNVFGFPTIFILDKNSIIREKILGDIQTGKLQELVVKQFNIQKEIEANYEKIHSH